MIRKAATYCEEISGSHLTILLDMGYVMREYLLWELLMLVATASSWDVLLDDF